MKMEPNKQGLLCNVYNAIVNIVTIPSKFIYPQMFKHVRLYRGVFKWDNNKQDSECSLSNVSC